MLAKLLAERERPSWKAAKYRLTCGSWQPQRDSNPCLHLERDVQGYVVTWGDALKPRWIAISLSALARI